MHWKVSTAPTTEPVSRTEMKLHLRVDHTTDDDLIDALIKSAREWCEMFEGKSYMTQTITAYLDNFSNTILLPHPPLLSVSTVKYYDTGGTLQTLASSYYTVDTTAVPGRIYLAYGQSWPATRDIPNAVEIIYTAGYHATQTTTTEVPARVKAAIKLIVGHLYEHREEATEESIVSVPFAVKNLLFERSFT
jgi:uncharacterized phiE125 gp8 family phage protein